MTVPIRRRGLMLVLSSPSGAGKSSTARALLARDDQIVMSVSATTRPPRSGERDGVDYHFVDPARFEALVAEDALLEHARVFGHLYGTPRAPVEAALSAGRDVLFDIDWQGTQQVKQSAGEDLVSVFLLPPSRRELERRLRARAQDPEDIIAFRMSKADEEIGHWSDYEYVLVNESLGATVDQVAAILAVERRKRARQIGLAAFVRGLRGED